MPGREGRRAPRGSLERPYSALTLRLVLAVFGLLVCLAAGVASAARGWTAVAVALGVLAAVAAVDIGVVLVRLRQRRREGGPPPSLFG
ncbi:DUF6343 family protein [Allonocardiopsis opalescens]|uniref:Uncharacterized protein n=1 Tax=Allonocardiopsis opalescens TaxID=1144618 RepID=A0A2T0QEC3_9ACTN|nr:DUF6343 family protein [Allonocardiopsis opalescens]PRY02211.1 hypothetical protein CLV72_101812 [Allonocardiopsis opalescens]